MLKILLCLYKTFPKFQSGWDQPKIQNNILQTIFVSYNTQWPIQWKYLNFTEITFSFWMKDFKFSKFNENEAKQENFKGGLNTILKNINLQAGKNLAQIGKSNTARGLGGYCEPISGFIRRPGPRALRNFQYLSCN